MILYHVQNKSFKGYEELQINYVCMILRILLKINIEKLLFQTNKHVCKPTYITEEPEKISVKARKSKENTLTDAS